MSTSGAEAQAPPRTGAAPAGADPQRAGDDAGGRFWRAVDRGPRGRGWRITSVVLLVLGCVLAPLAVGAAWARNLAVDQQAYLEAVSPLAEDPVIIAAVENRAVNAIDDGITSLNLAGQLSEELTQFGWPPRVVSLVTALAPALRGQVMDGVEGIVNRVLTSDEFATAWTNANARAHDEFVAVMQGEDSAAAAVSVKLGALLGTVRQKLESSGAEWANRLPEVPVEFDLANNADIQRLQGYYGVLNTLGTWLPIIAIALLLASVLVAPRRVRGIVRAGFWLAVSMVVLAVVLLAGRAYLVNNAPSQPEVTEAFVRQLTVNLRNTIRLVAIVALVAAAVAWLFGGSRSATSVRTAVRTLRARVDGSSWGVVVRIAAALVAVVLVLILFTLDDPGVVLAVVLVFGAGLAAIVAAARPLAPAPPMQAPAQAQPPAS
jgi:hypothetical protein